MQKIILIKKVTNFSNLVFHWLLRSTFSIFLDFYRISNAFLTIAFNFYNYYERFLFYLLI